MHSATKYLGGHSDLLGGALVVGDRELYDCLYFVQNGHRGGDGQAVGIVPLSRIKTLECASASRLHRRPARRVCRPIGG